VLVGRLGETPAVLFGDAGESHGWKSLKKDRRRARRHGGVAVVILSIGEMGRAIKLIHRPSFRNDHLSLPRNLGCQVPFSRGRHNQDVVT